MTNLSATTRDESVQRLREAADLLEQGKELDAGKMILAGLKPVALDLRRKYGPMVRLLVGSWVRNVFEE